MLAEKIADMSQANHYSYYQALSRCHLGWVLGAEGRLSEGIDQLVGGIDALDQSGTLLALAGFQILLAELYIHAGRVPEAAEALAMIARRNAPATWNAEIARLRGDISLAQSSPDPEAAEASYRSSLAIADRQNARSLMLKTVLSLSGLLQRTNRREEARQILVQCLRQMPESLDSQELKDARAALKELTKEEN